MITAYELENVILATEFSKARKLKKLESINLEDKELEQSIKTKILGSETEEEVLSRAEADDKHHWIEHFGNRAAADLLTLGKVQPETMLAMALLPEKEFAEVVKKATSTANKLNKLTLATEKELNLDLISQELA